MKIKYVDKKYIDRKAKRMEKKCLKEYGYSLTWGSISQRLERCILETEIEENGCMTIDIEKYTLLCKEVEDYIKREASK